MSFPLGLVSWLLVGLAAGLSADQMLPGPRRLGITPALLIGFGGAILGGLLATILGFGGLIGFDLRAFATATLAAVLCLLLLALARVPASPT